MSDTLQTLVYMVLVVAAGIYFLNDARNESERSNHTLAWFSLVYAVMTMAVYVALLVHMLRSL